MPLLVMKRSISRRAQLLLPVVAISVIFGGWWMVSEFDLIRSLFLPSPIAVAEAFIEQIKKGQLLPNIWASVWRVGTGFMLAVLLAFPLGIVMGLFKSMEAFFEPVVGFARYLPVPALLPLCILWFGIGDFQKIMVIFLGVFFQLVVLVSQKIASVPQEHIDTGMVLGTHGFRLIWRVIIPASAPTVYNDLRITAGWAWSYLVLAEIVAANQGIGHFIIESQRYLQTANMILGVVIIGLLGIFTDLAFRLAEARLFPWR